MRILTQVFYTAEALLALALYDLIALSRITQPHLLVRRLRLPSGVITDNRAERICTAVAEACVWYVKRARCLQRSAVATWLLRLHGVRAELVIGCRRVPLQSHSWVEINGIVVNDRPQYQKFFRVLDRL